MADTTKTTGTNLDKQVNLNTEVEGVNKAGDKIKDIETTAKYIDPKAVKKLGEQIENAKYSTYALVKGDTLSIIAEKLNAKKSTDDKVITYQELAKINGVNLEKGEDRHMAIGLEIKIPVSAERITTALSTHAEAKITASTEVIQVVAKDATNPLVTITTPNDIGADKVNKETKSKTTEFKVGDLVFSVGETVVFVDGMGKTISGSIFGDVSDTKDIVSLLGSTGTFLWEIKKDRIKKASNLGQKGLKTGEIAYLRDRTSVTVVSETKGKIQIKSGTKTETIAINELYSWQEIDRISDAITEGKKSV